MNVKKWVWCLHCERCFEVHLSREPSGEGALDFTPDFEMQLGVEQHGQVYAECPYEDCDGGMLDSGGGITTSRTALARTPCQKFLYRIPCTPRSRLKGPDDAGVHDPSHY